MAFALRSRKMEEGKCKMENGRGEMGEGRRIA
jgi:hypothetical protein